MSVLFLLFARLPITLPTLCCSYNIDIIIMTSTIVDDNDDDEFITICTLYYCTSYFLFHILSSLIYLDTSGTISCRGVSDESGDIRRSKEQQQQQVLLLLNEVLQHRPSAEEIEIAAQKDVELY